MDVLWGSTFLWKVLKCESFKNYEFEGVGQMMMRTIKYIP